MNITAALSRVLIDMTFDEATALKHQISGSPLSCDGPVNDLLVLLRGLPVDDQT